MQALRFIRGCLESDQDGAKKIKEVIDNGGIISAYYQIPGDREDLNRLSFLR